MLFPTDTFYISLTIRLFCRKFDQTVKKGLADFGSDGEKGVVAVGGWSEGREAGGVYRDGAGGVAGEVLGVFNGIENRGEICPVPLLHFN